MNSDITKKIIQIIVLTLVISYGLDKLVFFSLNKVSDKVMTGQAIGKLNHFLSLKDSTNLLVFGNSRANRHIDVAMLSKNGFNMGIDGIGVAYNSTLINTLNKDLKQIVLVHIDTKNFFDNDYTGSDVNALKTKFHRNPIITKVLDSTSQLSTLQKFYYSMNYNGTSIGILKNYFRPNYNFKSYNGYDGLVVTSSQEKIRDIVLAKSISNKECTDNHQINTTALNYLKSIKSFSEKAPNKTFIFITSPIYHDTCEIDNKMLNEIMQELNLTYTDFTNLYKDNKDNSYWKDATHMSNKGAEAFSNHLLQKYKSFQLKQ
ncbi:SGNH/GDSL hydrolase family protein [Winogradskyella sp. F6397]|uniref:SGNH/GDSL hydrolase family protein n=1 Tax=Winogradskyella marina TaxID=2785530 RepID=A0ABS0EHC7_9FLAO|nr:MULTISPECIES: SGNH/GDSL hydrolase family protein [Winogradskyella]MBF8149581.1 SGNH/GDSL hydrolase family protein [Winogradskyella marina]